MVRALEQEQESYRSRLFHFKGMHENASRHAKSLSVESAAKLEESSLNDDMMFRSQGSNNQPLKSRLGKDEAALQASQAREKQLQAGMSIHILYIINYTFHLSQQLNISISICLYLFQI